MDTDTCIANCNTGRYSSGSKYPYSSIPTRVGTGARVPPEQVDNILQCGYGLEDWKPICIFVFSGYFRTSYCS